MTHKLLSVWNKGNDFFGRDGNHLCWYCLDAFLASNSWIPLIIHPYFHSPFLSLLFNDINHIIINPICKRSLFLCFFFLIIHYVLAFWPFGRRFSSSSWTLTTSCIMLKNCHSLTVPLKHLSKCNYAFNSDLTCHEEHRKVWFEPVFLSHWCMQAFQITCLCPIRFFCVDLCIFVIVIVLCACRVTLKIPITLDQGVNFRILISSAQVSLLSFASTLKLPVKGCTPDSLKKVDLKAFPLDWQI